MFEMYYLLEELHHSYSQYILLGDRHFLGLNEFSGSALTLLLAFFMLLLTHSKQQTKNVFEAGFHGCRVVLFLALTVLAVNHVAWLYLVAIPVFPIAALVTYLFNSIFRNRRNAE